MFVSVVLWDTWWPPPGCWILMRIYYTFPPKNYLCSLVLTRQYNAKLLWEVAMFSFWWLEDSGRLLVSGPNANRPKPEYLYDILVCLLFNLSPLSWIPGLIALKSNPVLIHKLHDLWYHPGLWHKQCRTKYEQ